MADKKISRKLRKPYRMVIMNDETFEVKTALRLTPLNLVFIAATAIVFGIGLSMAFMYVLQVNFIGFSPNSNERSSAELREILVDVDSLYDLVGFQEEYIARLKKYVVGDFDTLYVVDTTDKKRILAEADLSNVNFPAKSKEDSLLRKELQNSAELLTAFDAYKSSSYAQILFPPVLKSVKTVSYSQEINHFGVDLAVSKGTEVFAIKDGVVIFADWTESGGNTIAIAHADGLISIYKQNSVMYAKTGIFVKQGNIIALSGGAKLQGKGDHLHFEMWQNGKSLDPEGFFYQFKI